MHGNRLSLFVAGLAATVCGMAFSAEPTIIPINKAKFLPGQRFDFVVEVRDPAASGIAVTVDGAPAEKFFGKKAVVKTVEGVAQYRIDQVCFPAAGLVDVKAVARSEGRDVSSSAEYMVALDKPVKRAKNVILYVGDGLSLPIRDMARILSKGIKEGKYNFWTRGKRQPGDVLAAGGSLTYADMTTAEELKKMAEYAYGVGPWKELLLPWDENNNLRSDEGAKRFLADAHANGLKVHIYTMRNEPSYLATDYNNDPKAEYRKWAAMGLDGFFTDFPETAVEARKEQTGNQSLSQ